MRWAATWAWLAVLVGAGAAWTGLAWTSDAGERCGLELVSDNALRDTDGFLSVEAGLDGGSASMLIDTGSDAGLVSADAVRRFGLRVDERRWASLSGTGGRPERVAVASASLSLGSLLVGGVALPVGELPALPRLVPAVAGLIGGDLLSAFEVEIDVAAGRLRLYRATGLSSLCRDLPPWPGRFDTVALTPVGHRMALPVLLDGRAMTALLDTGARSRIVSRAAALAAGVDASVLAGEAGGLTSGIGGKETVYHWHRFGSLQIGGQTDAAPVLTVTALAGPFAMLLGADWFERHRVWVSYGTGRLFFQPPGPAHR